MASNCIKECINDTSGRVRPTYANLHRWPEAEAEFVRSMSHGSAASSAAAASSALHLRVVDSISCRQMYLRSYTFSRREDEDDDVGENQKRCFGGGATNKAKKKKLKKKMNKAPRDEEKKNAVVKRSLCFVLGKDKTVSCSAFLSKMVRRWMSCSIASKVNVDR